MAGSRSPSSTILLSPGCKPALPLGKATLAEAEPEANTDVVTMTVKAQAAKNVSATWLNLVVHAGVGFFLSPYILHKLGDGMFSLWILIFAFTGYYGLLDLGIRSSIVRYVAKFSATNQGEDLARFLSSSLIFYSIAGLVVLLLTGVGFFRLQDLFKIPQPDLQSARLVFLLAGLGVAASFPLTVFVALLEGMQKFSWVQLVQLGITVLRAALIVFALHNGGGLLAISLITVAANLLGYLLYFLIALSKFPIPFSWKSADRSSLRKMLTFGTFAFVILVAEKLRFHSDETVIGALLSATAITSFAIGSRLVEYATYTVRSLAQIFTPMSSQFHATGDMDRLRRMLVVGNQACALIIFPICVVLIVLGKSIIQVWVGEKYLSSYPVLVWLAVPKTLYLAQSTSTRILLGMNKHRTLALVLLLEGVANVLLSAFLLPRFGVVGVAIGTALPLACTSLLFLPQHICRRLGISLNSFLVRAYFLPFILCLPLAAILWILKNQFAVHSYIGVGLQVACGGAIYALVLAAVFFKGQLGDLLWRLRPLASEPKV